jgi:hypothetical protein
VHVGEHAARRREIQRQRGVDVNDLAEATASIRPEDALHGSAEVVRVILDQPALRGRSRGAEREPLGVAGRDGLSTSVCAPAPDCARQGTCAPTGW